MERALPTEGYRGQHLGDSSMPDDKTKVGEPDRSRVSADQIMKSASSRRNMVSAPHKFAN
jgi:hypothetical protein